MKIYAELSDNNVVINTIVWDGISPYDVSLLFEITEYPQVGIGWKLEHGQWVAPEPVLDSPHEHS